MMEQEPATPWVEGSTLSCFCACAEAKLREIENSKALILNGGPDEPDGACCPEEGHTLAESLFCVKQGLPALSLAVPQLSAKMQQSKCNHL
jgi:hypothetical protein